MREDRTGLIYGFVAYLLWGLFPLYFNLLSRSGAMEIVAYRVLFSMLSCLAVLVVVKRWHQLGRLLRNRRASLVLLAAGVLVTVNWSIYIYAVNTHRTLDASMGYFINPLISALLGVLVLGERLRRVQWIAFALGAIAVVVLIVGYGQVPIIALGLALTFGTYGLVKKKVGARAPALAGMAIETMAMMPLAVGYLVWLSVTGAATATDSLGYLALMMLSGPITAVPLVLFASAARRISLTMIGMLQYAAPILQFLTGWAIFHEPMPPARWAGFVLIWIAVLIFASDGVRSARAANVDVPRP